MGCEKNRLDCEGKDSSTQLNLISKKAYPTKHILYLLLGQPMIDEIDEPRFSQGGDYCLSHVLAIRSVEEMRKIDDIDKTSFANLDISHVVWLSC